MSLFQITEGWSEALVAQLLIANVPFDATGMTAASIVKDVQGVAVTVPTSWSVASVAQIQLSPVGTEFVAVKQPYTIHFKITDGTGAVSFFPPGDPEFIEVAAP